MIEVLFSKPPLDLLRIFDDDIAGFYVLFEVLNFEIFSLKCPRTKQHPPYDFAVTAAARTLSGFCGI